MSCCAGLTSRPRPPQSGSQADSPYALRSQAALTLALAQQLGLRRVIFVGHSDGALLALLATALAAESQRDVATPLRAPPAGGVRRSESEGTWKRLQELKGDGGAADPPGARLLPSPTLMRSHSEPASRLLAAATVAGARPPPPSAAQLLERGSPAAPAGGQQHRQRGNSPPQSEAGGSTEPSTPDSRSRGGSRLYVLACDPAIFSGKVVGRWLRPHYGSEGRIACVPARWNETVVHDVSSSPGR